MHYCNNNLVLKNYNGEWKVTFNASDIILEKMRNAYIAIYGERAYNNGYCNPDYQMMYGKTLNRNFNVNVKSAIFNKDGSMTVVLGFANGFDKARTVKSVTGTISFGKDSDSMKQVIDLSKIKFGNIRVSAGDVEYVTVTIKQNQLVNKLNGTFEFANCSIDCNTKYSG